MKGNYSIKIILCDGIDRSQAILKYFKDSKSLKTPQEAFEEQKFKKILSIFKGLTYIISDLSTTSNIQNLLEIQNFLGKWRVIDGKKIYSKIQM